MKRLLPIALLAVATITSPATVPSYTPELEGRAFDRAWKLVADHYWDRSKTGATWAEARARFRPRAIAATDRPAFYTVLGEMLSSLDDSHVYAIDPVQVAIGKDRDAGRAATGFGFTMLPDDDGRWLVQRVAPASSAAQAGVEIGWAVRSINGKPIDIDYQPENDERSAFIFADEHGVTHVLTLLATLEQPEPERRAALLADNVLLIKLDGFDPGNDKWLAHTIADASPKAIILDLRDNEGGDADVLAKVAGLFFAQDRPLVRRIANRETVQQLHGSGARAFTGPLAVLIGPDSASGAEALAAVIDESGRGTTVGERSAGALTGAAEYRLPDGGQLSVAEFDIRTPSGRRVEGVGLEPRIPVRPSLADRRAGRDPALQRALALVRTPQQTASRQAD